LTFVGFGFGAIQAGLFLHEAGRSGAFGRLVVADVLPEVVAAVRRSGGRFTVNIAHADRVEQAEVGPVEIFDLNAPDDRRQIIEALASADEIATAVPGVGFYVSDRPSSLHRVLAEGLRQKAARGGPRAVVYAAENHNHAAEILEESVLTTLAPGETPSVRSQVRFLNTVIGKMSGVVTDPREISARQLRPVTPGGDRAFLVEAFNRILISRVRFDAGPPGAAFERGLAVFEEKDDLLPFEEAKLYGHNATHALAAYVGAMLGLRLVADLVEAPGAMSFLRAAFIEESGAALIRKYRGADPLFTPEGFALYAEDLLTRMTNPWLGDSLERVGRHPERKLGWQDRLIGTIRLALSRNVAPPRYACGAAAALAALCPAALDDPTRARALLTGLWDQGTTPPAEQEPVLECVAAGLRQLSAWRAAGFPRLDLFLGRGAGESPQND
jgi:mannitol-1-phosphate 5-dehydrogenase